MDGLAVRPVVYSRLDLGLHDYLVVRPSRRVSELNFYEVEFYS